MLTAGYANAPPKAYKDPCRVAVVGSRNFSNLSAVCKFISQLPKGCTVISGGARGVDQLAEDAAKEQGIPTVIYPANWKWRIENEPINIHAHPSQLSFTPGGPTGNACANQPTCPTSSGSETFRSTDAGNCS
jgi:hypothetical protein